MNELLISRQSAGVELLLEEVFDCFNVMVGGLFDLLDPGGVLQTEILPDSGEPLYVTG